MILPSLFLLIGITLANQLYQSIRYLDTDVCIFKVNTTHAARNLDGHCIYVMRDDRHHHLGCRANIYLLVQQRSQMIVDHPWIIRHSVNVFDVPHLLHTFHSDIEQVLIHNMDPFGVGCGYHHPPIHIPPPNNQSDGDDITAGTVAGCLLFSGCVAIAYKIWSGGNVLSVFRTMFGPKQPTVPTYALPQHPPPYEMSIINSPVYPQRQFAMVDVPPPYIPRMSRSMRDIPEVPKPTI